MVVVDPAREAFEIRGLEAGRHGSCWRPEATYRSDSVAVSCQLGSRERTSRANVHRSICSTTLLGDPSTTSPCASRVTEASLAENRTLSCAVAPMSRAPTIDALSIETTVVDIVCPASARAWIALSKLAKASGDIKLLRASESPAAKAWTTMSYAPRAPPRKACGENPRSAPAMASRP